MSTRFSPPQEVPWGWREAVDIVAFVGALLILVMLYALRLREDGASLPWSVAMLVGLLAFSELSYFATMRYFGARPRPGWKWGVGPALASWWTAEGHKFAARQFAVVGSFPAPVTLVAGIAYVLATPVDPFPGACLLSAYALVHTKSAQLALTALRQPEGTLFEEHGAGSLLYRPPT